MANNLIPLQAINPGPRKTYADRQEQQLTLENLRQKQQMDQMKIQADQQAQQDRQRIRQIVSSGLPDDQIVQQMKSAGLIDAAMAYEKGIAERNKAIAKMDKATRDAHAAEIQQDSQNAAAILQAPPEQQPQLWDSLGTGKPYPGPDQLKFMVNHGLTVLQQIDKTNKEEDAKRATAKEQRDITAAAQSLITDQAQARNLAASAEQTELENKRIAEGKPGQPPAPPQLLPGRDIPLPPAVQAQKMAAAQAGRAPEEPVAVINPKTGKSILVPKSQSYGKEPGNSRERAATGQERTALGFYNRAKDALDTIEPLEPAIQELPLSAQTVMQYAPNWLQSQLGQSYRQAQRQFTEARLRKESGAAINKDEYEKDAKTYFAAPGDSKATLEQKRKSRAKVLESIKISAGRAYAEYYGEENKPDSGGGKKDPLGIR